MKAIFYILMLVSLNSLAQVEGGNWIESNNLKVRINADGQLANYNKSASSELMIGSNNHLFKYINIWISGFISNNLFISSVNSLTNKSDYGPGPIDSLSFNGADPKEWNKVWSVSASEILEHKRNFKNTNYTLPLALKNWPANGSNGFNKYLAPFIDYDNNGIYEPSKGDYPKIEGDKALYFIVNDNSSEHKASGGKPLKIEIYGMAYSMPNIQNTVFIKYFIINRTDVNFKDINVSFHTGFQLGNDNDNYCGSHVGENMIFSYNGDANDDNHFGTNKPLAAFIVLNKKITSTLYITNDSAKETGMPVSIPEEHRNLMEGKWKNSKKLTFGADGIINSAPANFVYPGNTDPAFPTQNWVEDNSPGNRTMLLNLSYNNLVSKDFIELDVALTGFEKSNGDPYQFLGVKAKEIKNLWAQNIATNTTLKKPELFNIECPVRQGQNFYNSSFLNFEKVIIYNSMGKMITSINPKVENVLTIGFKGIYYVFLVNDNQYITKKIFIL